MDLPTYTNIWRIEKRLYKLYDFRLPAPLPINWIAVFTGITVPYIVLLVAIGLPFSHTLVWLYVLPPGVLTWLTTRPVIESKRLPELLESQVRYLTEPRVWCRLAPLSEKDQIVVTAKVWHSRRVPHRRKAGAGIVALRERGTLVRRNRAAALPASPEVTVIPAAEPVPALPAAASMSAAGPSTSSVLLRGGVRGQRTAPRVRGTGAQRNRVTERVQSPRRTWAPERAPAAQPPQAPETPPQAPATAPQAPATTEQVPAGKPGRFRLAALRSRPVGPAPALPSGAAFKHGQPGDAEPRLPIAPAVPVAPADPSLGPAAAPVLSTMPVHATPDVYPATQASGSSAAPDAATRPPDAPRIEVSHADPVRRPVPPASVPPASVSPASVSPASVPPASVPPVAAPPANLVAEPSPVPPAMPVASTVASPGQDPEADMPIAQLARSITVDPAIGMLESGPDRGVPHDARQPNDSETASIAAETGNKPETAIPAEAAETLVTEESSSKEPQAQLTAESPAVTEAPQRSVPPPVVKAVADTRGERKIPSIERALSGPSRDRNLSWHGKVRIVTGAGAVPGPGARDQEALDRARARLPLRTPKRVLMLGCTSGAGQTVTTLMTGHILASLREHPVAAVDLHDGTLARYSAPAAWLEEILRGKAPRQHTPVRPDGLHPTPKPNPARLDIIASHDLLRDGDEIKLAVQLSRHYPLTMLDPGATGLTKLLKITDQLVVVVPASVEAASALADTRDWLDAHGFADLAVHSVTLINGVSRRSLTDVEHAELVARGRCRAIVRVPWDDMLPVGITGPSTLRPQTRVAYTALAGVLVAGMAAAPVRTNQ